MNSLERHKLALDMKEADRVPVAPSFLTRAVRKAGHRGCEVPANTSETVIKTVREAASSIGTYNRNTKS